MPALKRVELSDETTVFIQTIDEETLRDVYEPGVSETGAIDTATKLLEAAQELPEKTVDAISIGIAAFSKKILSRFDEEFVDRPVSVAIEYGVNIMGGGGIQIVSASAEATLKVTVTWDK